MAKTELDVHERNKHSHGETVLIWHDYELEKPNRCMECLIVYGGSYAHCNWGYRALYEDESQSKFYYVDDTPVPYESLIMCWAELPAPPEEK